MIKALIFDCWGTLFTSSLHPHPFEVFAKRLGFSIQDRDFLKVFEEYIMTNNNPVYENVERLLFKLKIDYTPDFVNELTNILLSSLPAQIPYTDTIETLNELKQDYRLILLSNSFNEGFINLKNEFPIDDLFEIIILSCQERIIKPNKKLYEIALNKSGLNSDEVIMIGDNYHDDYLAANDSGIKAILLDRRGRYPEITDGKISNLTELKQKLANL